MKLSKLKLSGKDTAYVSTSFRTINEIERVGDYAVNIVEYAQKMMESSGHFSDAAQNEIRNTQSKIHELYGKAMETYDKADREILKEAHEVEQEIDGLTEAMADNHIQRLSDGICTVGVGAEFLALTSDMERVADHYYNVGKSIKEITKSAKPVPAK